MQSGGKRLAGTSNAPPLRHSVPPPPQRGEEFPPRLSFFKCPKGQKGRKGLKGHSVAPMGNCRADAGVDESLI